MTSALDPVRRRLTRARRRLLWQRWLVAAGWVWGGAAAALSLVEGTLWIAAALGAPLPPWTGAVLPLTAALAAAGTLVAGVWAARSAPPLLELARRADTRFGLQERLSTALEVDARGTRGPVERLLVRDAASLAPAVAADRLTPWSIPSAVPAWLAALALAALTLALPPATGALVRAPARPDAAEPAPADAAATAGTVHQVAELLTAEGAQRNDAYLQAVARSLEDLGSRIDRGELSGAELDAELSRLFDHLDRALGTEDAALSRALREVAQGTRASTGAGGPDTVTPPMPRPPGDASTADAPSGVGGTPPAGPSDSPTAAELGAPSSGSAPAGDVDAALRKVLERLRQRADERSAARPPVTSLAMPGAQSGGYTAPDPEMLKRLEERRRALAQEGEGDRAGGAPVGAARESTAGAGDMAGDGSRPLDAGQETGADLGGLDTAPDQVALPGNDTGQGPRVTVQAVPQAGPTATPEPTAPSATGFASQREAARTSEWIDLPLRSVVARYFLPDAAAGEAPGASEGPSSGPAPPGPAPAAPTPATPEPPAPPPDSARPAEPSPTQPPR